MQTDHRPLSQFRNAVLPDTAAGKNTHAAMLFTALLLIISSQSYAQLGHAQRNNWFEITKTPISCIGSSVNEIDGKLYMIGGEQLPPNTRMGISSVRIYDIAANEWTTGSDMPTARPLVPKLSIGNNVYAIGGYRHDSVSWNRVEIYDVSTDSWTRLADMPTPRIWFTGCIYDDKIYIMGGISPSALANELDPKGLDIVERYDPATNTWDTCASMITGKFGSTTCVLNDRLYVIGGIKEKAGNWPALTNVEVYDPVTDKWEQKTKMHVARTELTNVVHDGKIYAIGGFPDAFGHTVYSSFEVFDPTTNSWILHNDPEDMHPQGTAYQTIDVGGRIYALNAVGPYVDFHPVFPEVYVYNEAIITVKSDSMLTSDDIVVTSVHKACRIYIVPPATPAKLDSIIGNSILSFDAQSLQEHKFTLNELSSGTYLIYAVALDGRIDLNYFQFQVIDHLPECIIMVQDVDSKEQVDSCLLVVNEQDSIPGIQGNFDLTGWANDTCSLRVTCMGYHEFDTTLIILPDTTVITLIPIIEGVAESANREIRIFPNPAQGLITVQTREEGVHSLEFIDLKGHVLKKMDFSENPVQVDLSPYQGGIYLIRVCIGDKVYMGKVVKY